MHFKPFLNININPSEHAELLNTNTSYLSIRINPRSFTVEKEQEQTNNTVSII